MSVEAVSGTRARRRHTARIRELAESDFGGPGFGLHDTDLIGTPDTIVARLRELGDLGFGQVVLFTHDRASGSDAGTAREVIPAVSG